MDMAPVCPTVNLLADTLVQGYTTGSTVQSGGNPHPFGCMGLTSAGDVWYRFNATSERATIQVYPFGTTAPLASPMFALYKAVNGDCQELLPVGCASGVGQVSRTFESLIPGQVYFIQVASAIVGNDGDFGLKIYSKRTCDECVQRTELFLYPPPVNGGYPPGTTVHMVAKISGFSQLNSGTNRLHGIYPTFGPGWDLSTLGPVTNEFPVSVDGAGSWVWDNLNTHDGFYYDADSDGLPSNNLGDLNTQFGTDWTCGWSIKTTTFCNAAVSLEVNLNTSTDAETGSNTNSGYCGGDTAATYELWQNCCGTVNLVSVTPESCGEVSFDGSYYITVGIPLYDFYLYDDDGNQVDAGTGLSNTSVSATNMSQGSYVAWFYNINSSCWTSINFVIPGNMVLNITQSAFGCVNQAGSGAAIVNVTGTNSTGPYDFDWYTSDGSFFGQNIGSTVPFDTVTSLFDGECYYVTVRDAAGCSVTSEPFCITLQPADPSTMNFASPVCITPGTVINPNQQVNGDVFYFNSTPSGSVATIDVNTGQFTPDVEGKYLIQYQSSLVSLCPAYFEDTVMVAFIPPTPVVSGQASYDICQFTTQMPSLAIVNDTAYNAIWLNAGLIPVGSGDTYTPSASLAIGSYAYYAVYYSTFNSGCFSTTTFGINVFETPTVEVGSDITICPGDTATLTAITNNSGNTFFWQPYDPSYLQTQTGNGTNLAYPVSDLTLYVVSSLPNPPWCQATDSIHIFVDETGCEEFLPYTGLTPNGDGKNDTWYIEGIEQLSNTTVSVYSRWGDRVWDTNQYNNTSNPWRGVDSSGNAVPDGTYYYVIITNGRVTQGWIELTR